MAMGVGRQSASAAALTAVAGSLLFALGAASVPGCTRSGFKSWTAVDGGTANDAAASIPGDFDGDGCVSCLDYDVLKEEFQQQGEGLVADLDGNGVVGFSDFGIFNANFASGCQGPMSSSLVVLIQGLDDHEGRSAWAALTCPDDSCAEMRVQLQVENGKAYGSFEHKLLLEGAYKLNAFVDTDGDLRCSAQDLAWQHEVLSTDCRHYAELDPQESVAPEGCAHFTVIGDLDGDGCADDDDLSVALSHFDQSGSYAEGDLNGDGVINDADIQLLTAGIQAGCVTTAPSPLLGWAALTQTATNSYVDLVVDWSNDLAFAASRESDTCVAIIDIRQLDQPSLLGRMGPGLPLATTGGTCIGLALTESNKGLVLSSQGGGAIEAWSLGVEPRNLAYQQLSTIGASLPKRMALVVDVTETEVYVARAADGIGAEHFSLSPGGLLSGPLNSYTSTCSNNHLSAIGEKGLIMGCWENLSPVVLVNTLDMTQQASFPMDSDGETGLWCSAVSSDMTRIFAGGWVSAFLEVEPVALQIAVRHRFDNDGVYRAATFYDDGARVMLAAVNGDRHLEIWDATDIATPVLEKRSLLPSVEGELYGVQVNADLRRAVVVSNRGHVAIVDLELLATATMTWPTF